MVAVALMYSLGFRETYQARNNACCCILNGDSMRVAARVDTFTSTLGPKAYDYGFQLRSLKHPVVCLQRRQIVVNAHVMAFVSTSEEMPNLGGIEILQGCYIQSIRDCEQRLTSVLVVFSTPDAHFV